MCSRQAPNSGARRRQLEPRNASADLDRRSTTHPVPRMKTDGKEAKLGSDSVMRRKPSWSLFGDSILSVASRPSKTTTLALAFTAYETFHSFGVLVLVPHPHALS